MKFNFTNRLTKIINKKELAYTPTCHVKELKLGTDACGYAH